MNAEVLYPDDIQAVIALVLEARAKRLKRAKIKGCSQTIRRGYPVAVMKVWYLVNAGNIVAAKRILEGPLQAALTPLGVEAEVILHADYAPSAIIPEEGWTAPNNF